MTARLGIVAEVIFTVTWLVAALWQGSGYRWVRDDLSEMGAVTAPHAWYFLVPQAVAGLLTIGFALFGLLPALRPAGRAGVLAAMLAAGSAVQDLSDAAFRLDCRVADGCTAAQTTASWHGQLHAAFSLVCILMLIGAMFMAARAFQRLPAWNRWTGPTRLVGCLAAAGLVGVALPATASVHGLLQRGVALLAAAWGASVAYHVLTRTRQVHPDIAAPD